MEDGIAVLNDRCHHRQRHDHHDYYSESDKNYHHHQQSNPFLLVHFLAPNSLILLVIFRNSLVAFKIL